MVEYCEAYRECMITTKLWYIQESACLDVHNVGKPTNYLAFAN